MEVYLKTLHIVRDDFDAFVEVCCNLRDVLDEKEFRLKLSENTLPDLTYFPKDSISSHMLPEPYVDGHIALKSSANGNCLFNSLSILLVGNEKLATELRLRTCLELTKNVNIYMNHPDIASKEILTLNGNLYTVESLYNVAVFGEKSGAIYQKQGFKKAIESEICYTAINKSFCGLLHIIALATVVGMPIEMIYPDQNFRLLPLMQTIYEPKEGASKRKLLRILWSNIFKWEKDKLFVPNHFVPVIPNERSNSAVQPPRAKVFFTKPNKEIIESNMESQLPLAMSKEWYAKEGKNVLSNAKRNSERGHTKEIAPYTSLADAIKSLQSYTSYHLKAVADTGLFIIRDGPLIKTQEVVAFYKKAKGLSDKKIMSKTMFEILKKHLPVCQIYLNKYAYIFELKLKDTLESVQNILQASSQDKIAAHIADTIGDVYHDVLRMMDTKRDKDVLKGILASITSIRFASRLQKIQSRSAVRHSKNTLLKQVDDFKMIEKTSLTVRDDMTVGQQHQFHQRIVTRRKFKEMRVIAAGRGAHLKCQQLPELAMILEGVFGESGLESHPRLTDDVLYRAKNNAVTMKQAREVLLALSPENFRISLSCCYNYTQNFKAGTYQAKRHHEGKNINACISLHAPPRIGVEKASPNLHWTSANINLILSAKRKEDTIFDSKDAKCIVCADIAPVQRPGKTWKKREGILLDHEWNQSRKNAVTPMAHLFLNDNMNEGTESIVRSGKAVVLINLSLYESSGAFRCMNEFFKLMMMPNLSKLFKSQESGTLKKNLVNIVDNGPGEQPSSPLVQMLLVRLRKFLKLESVCQVSYGEYNSKRNFVERVHAQENAALSRHGPFSSKMVHKTTNTPFSQEHRENMEAMATEVISCLRTANFGGSAISAERGVTNIEMVFDDEKTLKTFLSLSEGKKKTFLEKYRPKPSNTVRELCATWSLNPEFEGSYYEDYQEMVNAWKDKYTFESTVSQTSMKQPIPDYFRWYASGGELHYMPFESRLKVLEGTWDTVPGMFLPSDILQMAFDCIVCPFGNISDDTLIAISFLAWLPVEETKSFFEQQKRLKEEDLNVERLRSELRDLPLYKKTKAELAKMCQELNIEVSGTTKVDIALSLARHKDIKLGSGFKYNGDVSTIPALSSKVRELGIAALKTILDFHLFPTRETKDQLVLNVCLLRSGRKHLINKIKKDALLKLIKSTELLISMQNAIEVCQGRKRKYETVALAKISKYKPRSMASACGVFVKSAITIPSWLKSDAIQKMLGPLKLELGTVSQVVDHSIEVPSKDVAFPTDTYEKYFEIGAKVLVKWNKGDLGHLGWRAGWFAAEVQDFDLMNDWIKVEYSTEEGYVYKIEVSKYVDEGLLKLKNPVF